MARGGRNRKHPIQTFKTNDDAADDKISDAVLLSSFGRFRLLFLSCLPLGEA